MPFEIVDAIRNAIGANPTGRDCFHHRPKALFVKYKRTRRATDKFSAQIANVACIVVLIEKFFRVNGIRRRRLIVAAAAFVIVTQLRIVVSMIILVSNCFVPRKIFVKCDSVLCIWLSSWSCSLLFVFTTNELSPWEIKSRSPRRENDSAKTTATQFEC